jgi:hypothetical protein
MAQIISREPMPGSGGRAEVLRFDDGTSLTIPAGAGPMSQAGPVVSSAPTAPQPVLMQGAPGDTMQSREPPPAQPQGGVPAQPPPRQQVIDPMTPYGVPLSVVADIANARKAVPGRAAYDPRAVVAAQVPVPVQRQMQTVGAQPFDPEKLAEIHRKETEAADLNAEASQMQAANNLQIQHAMYSEAQDIAQQQAAKQRAAEDQYARGMSQLTQEAQAVAQKQINPNRVFENMGVGQKIMLGLSAAMSGYATQGRENPAMQYVMKLVDNDIRAQQNQIERQQGTADNALARLSQQWGGIQAGAAALRVQQLEVGKQRALAMGAELGTPIAQARSQALAAQLEAAQQRELVTLQNAARGQVTQTEVAQMQIPVKGQAGGYVPLTYEEKMKRLKQQQDLYKGGYENVGLGLKNETEANQLAQGFGSEKQQMQAAERQEHLGKSLSEMAYLNQNIDQIMSHGGIRIGQDGKAIHGDIPGVGMGYNLIAAIPFFGKDLAQMAAGMNGPDAAIVRHQAEEALTYKIRDASGAAFSTQEAEKHARALAAGFLAGPDAFAQAMVNFQSAVREKELSLRAGAGVEVSDAYDRSYSTLKSRQQQKQQGIQGNYTGTVIQK